ncbi:MAG: hypothetical protein Q9213_002668 [Squamulea squamosa]
MNSLIPQFKDLLSNRLKASSQMEQQRPPPTSNASRRGSAGPLGRKQDQNAMSSEDIDDLKLKLRMSELELSRLRNQYDELIQQHHSTIKQTQDSRARAGGNQNELELTLEKNAMLERELQACKNEIFKMQPISKIPDSEVAQLYDDLHVYILIWVESQIAGFRTKFRKEHNGPLPSVFHHGDVLQLEELLAAFPIYCVEYLVCFVLENMLSITVFAKRIVLHGLNSQDTVLLQRIERSITQDRPRDAGSVRNWRADTLSALSSTKYIQHGRLKARKDITEAIFDELTTFFPIIEKTSESLQEFHDKVIDPAVNLATKIQISPTNYEFVPKMEKYFDSFDVHSVGYDQLSRSRFVDIETGKTLKVDSPIQTNEKGEIGTQVMVVVPALYRCNPGQDPLLLVKEIDLVKLHKPLGRRRAATVRQKPAFSAFAFHGHTVIDNGQSGRTNHSIRINLSHSCRNASNMIGWESRSQESVSYADSGSQKIARMTLEHLLNLIHAAALDCKE